MSARQYFQISDRSVTATFSTLINLIQLASGADSVITPIRFGIPMDRCERIGKRKQTLRNLRFHLVLVSKRPDEL